MPPYTAKRDPAAAGVRGTDAAKPAPRRFPGHSVPPDLNATNGILRVFYRSEWMSYEEFVIRREMRPTKRVVNTSEPMRADLRTSKRDVQEKLF